MRVISTLVLLIIASTLSCQTKNGLEENKLTINIKTVDHIDIAAYCSPLDSCRGTLYYLNSGMIQNLSERLNKSNSKDSCNFTEEYLLYINFKDGTTRSFRIHGSFIKDNNYKCFDIKDPDFFENLWRELDKEWIKLNKK